MSIEPELKNELKEIKFAISELNKICDTISKKVEKLEHVQQSSLEKITSFGANAVTIGILKEILDLLKLKK